VIYQAPAVAFTPVRHLAQLAPAFYFTMRGLLLPLDFIFTRYMSNQIGEKPFRFFRSIIIGCHRGRDVPHAWIDVVVINSQLIESHRNAHWVVNIELYALRLPLGVHHEPRYSHQIRGLGFI